jgi:Family of unknown function (DUF6335)
MARKKPARPAKKAKKQAKRKSASRAAARKGSRKSAKRLARKGSRKTASKRSAKSSPASARATAGKRTRAAKAAAPKRTTATKPKKKSMLASAVGAAVGSAIAAGVRAAMSGKKPNLDRPRKTVADVHGIPSSLGAAGAATAASTGRAEMKERLRQNTSASPALTSGDVDADWESAESVGDEAPGGDNPTPDQDVVDDIGRALGVEYEDDEELQGGAEIGERDRRRWELDPASKDLDEDDEN